MHSDEPWLRKEESDIISTLFRDSEVNLWIKYHSSKQFILPWVEYTPQIMLMTEGRIKAFFGLFDTVKCLRQRGRRMQLGSTAAPAFPSTTVTLSAPLKRGYGCWHVKAGQGAAGGFTLPCRGPHYSQFKGSPASFLQLSKIGWGPLLSPCHISKPSQGFAN